MYGTCYLFHNFHWRAIVNWNIHHQHWPICPKQTREGFCSINFTLIIIFRHDTWNINSITNSKYLQNIICFYNTMNNMFCTFLKFNLSLSIWRSGRCQEIFSSTFASILVSLLLIMYFWYLFACFLSFIRLQPHLPLILSRNETLNNFRIRITRKCGIINSNRFKKGNKTQNLKINNQ